MAVLIPNELALAIADTLYYNINTVKVYFSDNTSLEINNISKTENQDEENQKYVVSFTFPINLETSKTLVMIEYYLEYNQYYFLFLVRDELSINLDSGITSITHEISITYQV
jgi:hypothetical protein